MAVKEVIYALALTTQKSNNNGCFSLVASKRQLTYNKCTGIQNKSEIGGNDERFKVCLPSL